MKKLTLIFLFLGLSVSAMADEKGFSYEKCATDAKGSNILLKRCVALDKAERFYFQVQEERKLSQKIIKAEKPCILKCLKKAELDNKGKIESIIFSAFDECKSKAVDQLKSGRKLAI